MIYIEKSIFALVQRTCPIRPFLLLVLFIAVTIAFSFAPHIAQAQELRALSTQDILSLSRNVKAFQGMDANYQQQIPTFGIQRHTNTAITNRKHGLTDKESLIEQMFNNRTDDKLSQFGYTIFSQKKTLSDPQSSLGSVQDNYILGNGDYLEITFRGTRNDSKQYHITAQGTLLIDGIDPITTAGITLGELKERLNSIASQTMINTKVFVSLTDVRQIGVMVLGEVKEPSMYQFSPFHSILDAIYRAGGIKKTGSLRQVKLLRDKEQIIVDLYSLILDGEMPEHIQLRDGDRIVVPMIGSTVAVAGDVKRPAIFETSRGSENFSLDDLMEITGDVLNAGSNRFIRLSLDDNGNELVSPIEKDNRYSFKDGDILLVQAAKEKRVGSVKLIGPAQKSGTHSLHKASTLSQLLPSSDALKNTAYPLIGFIKRYNSETMGEEWIEFSPKQIVTGKEDRPLRNSDTIILFTTKDIYNLDKNIWENALESKAIDFDPAALNAIEPSATHRSSKQRDKNDVDSENAIYNDGTIQPPPSAQELEAALYTPAKNKMIMALLKERAVRIRGSIRHEGLYPITGKTTLADIIAASGGLTPDADTKAVEITLAPNNSNNPNINDDTSLPPTVLSTSVNEEYASAESSDRLTLDISMDGEDKFVLHPYDTVRINKRFNPIERVGVKILGEVKRPGIYDLKKGDTILDLITRAGGLTEFAFPEGAILTRVSAQKAEQHQFSSMANELDRQISILMTEKQRFSTDVAAQEERINAMKDMAESLRQVTAVGRITIEANPDILEQHPDKNSLLEEGDTLYFPKQSSTVMVRGEVYSPSILAYSKSKSPRDYISEAGGMTRLADEPQAYVLYPNGSSKPLDFGSWFPPMSVKVPAGSAIIVPYDPDPLDRLSFTGNVVSILSNLALTTMAIDNIRNSH